MVPGGVEVADILADPNYGGGGLRGEGSGVQPQLFFALLFLATAFISRTRLAQ